MRQCPARVAWRSSIKEELHRREGQDVTLCCLQESHIPVGTEMQFMKCHMSVGSDLGNESLRKKNPLCEHESLLHVLFEIDYLCMFMFSFVFLVRAHKGIDNE